MKKICILLTLTVLSGRLHARPLTDAEQQAVEKTIKAESAGQQISFIHQDFPYPEQTFTYCGYTVEQQGNHAGARKLFATFLGLDKEGRVLTASFGTDAATGKPTAANKLAFLCASAGYDLPVETLYFDGINQTREKSGIPPLAEKYQIK